MLSGAGGGLGEFLPEVPGQEFLDAVDGMIGDGGQRVAQLELWVESAEFGAADQAVDRCGALATGIGAGEQVILAAQSDGAQRSLGGVMPRAGLCRVRADWVRNAACSSLPMRHR